MIIMIEKRTGRRVLVISTTEAKIQYCFVGEEGMISSLRRTIFEKLFRPLEEKERPTQLTEEESLLYQEDQRSRKFNKRIVRTQNRKKRRSAIDQKANARREMLSDRKLRLKAVEMINKAGRLSVFVFICNSYIYEADLAPNNHIRNSYWYTVEFTKIQKLNRKSPEFVIPYIGPALRLKKCAFTYLIKQFIAKFLKEESKFTEEERIKILEEHRRNK